MTSKVCTGSPTLNALKNLNHQPSTPVKRIAPKQDAAEAEYTPKVNASKLVGIAKDNDFNGHGKLTLHQARYALSDNSLRLKDVLDLLEQFYPAVEIEQCPGNVLHLHFHTGKHRVVSATTELRRV